MATLTAVVVPAKALKDGKHKIRISVAHNGQTRYILTDILIDSVKEFRNGSIVKRPDAAYLNTKLRAEMQKYQESIDELKYINGLTCPELIESIKNGAVSKHRSIQSVFAELMEFSKAKDNTKRATKAKWNIISKFLNTGMLIENLNQSTVLSLEKSLRNYGLTNSSVNSYMSALIMVVNYALKCGYAQYRINPFVNFKKSPSVPHKSWLTVEEIKTIRDLKFKKESQRIARDLFMLSYYLGGINLIDILKVNFNIFKTRLQYIRQKTESIPKPNEYVEFDIPQEAFEIIRRLKGSDGLLTRAKGSRKAHEHYIAYHMNKIAERTGIKNLRFYSARKSFSQHALQLGVQPAVIDYILGHTLNPSKNILYAYVYVTPEMATEAVRKVLDNLK